MSNEKEFINFKNLITAIIAVVLIILITNILIGSDPKGLGFGLSIIAYGIGATISSAIFILSKNRKYSLDYYFVMVAGSINLYLTLQFIISVIQHEVYLSVWTIVNLIHLVGAALGLIMLNRLLKHSTKENNRPETE